jgi:hypothetical protein
MKWNNESMLTFTGLYKAKPVLWDPTQLKYYNKYTKCEAWEEVAKGVHFWNYLADCCRQVYESPVAKKRSSTGCHPPTGTASLYLVTFFAVFGPIKLIINSKSAGAMQVKFFYCPLISWNLKSANKLSPL